MAIIDVAIVGGGCSGLLVAAQLLRQGFRGGLTIIEPRAKLGRGLAYSTPCSDHLLNVPAGKMSAFASQPSHFLDWLRAGRYPDATASFFPPRSVYGEYLDSVLNQELRASLRTIRHVRAEVTCIDSDGSAAILTLNDLSTVHARQVVLALGNPASMPAPGVLRKGVHDRWHLSPWIGDALRVRESGERILLIGTGLTAVDAALALHRNAGACRVYMLSRRGILPQAHSAALKPVDAPAFCDRSDVRGMLRELRARIGEMQEQDLCWRAAIDALRPVSNEIWRQLSLPDRRRFLRHLKTYWETHRHRMAPEVRQRLDALQQNGSVEVIAGRLLGTDRQDNVIEARIGLRNGDEQRLSIDRIINCTGIHESYVNSPRPLIDSLIGHGLASANDLGIGFRTDGNGAVIDGQGKPSSILFTLGPPRKGELFETTAVPEIRVQAESLAQRLVQTCASWEALPAGRLVGQQENLGAGI